MVFGLFQKKKQQVEEIKQMPVYKIKGNYYYQDNQSGAYKNVVNPKDKLRKSEVSTEELNKTNSVKLDQPQI